jgi:hypothetical protein
MNRSVDNGKLIATVLTHAWRQTASQLTIPIDQLNIVAPLLLSTGAGALGWNRVRNSALGSSPAGLELEQAYRLHSLQSAIAERSLKLVLAILRSASTEPVLVKGWAVARLYPDAGLRPYGDFDLCVDPAQHREAGRLINENAKLAAQVDLHRGFSTLCEEPWEEVYSRSQLLSLDDVKVRIPCPEDHLRILCFHFLREGAWRPLWLCDIAIALETRPSDFDWDLFLGRNQRRRRWFACAIITAHQLLDANIEGVPKVIRENKLPSWFMGTVLKAWKVRSMQHRHAAPMHLARRAPGLVLRNLRFHWPNPIEAMVSMNRSFNELPRFPVQLGNCALRTIEFLRRGREREGITT